jgi:hypothetical protein
MRARKDLLVTSTFQELNGWVRPDGLDIHDTVSRECPCFFALGQRHMAALVCGG